ncbi:MAG: GHKL domain-containing protein [Eubacteriales bacterium]|nr:GHKL domain-containing protein [Eubacteriales bacterium]
MNNSFSFFIAYFIEAAAFLIYANGFFHSGYSSAKRIAFVGGTYAGLFLLSSVDLREWNLIAYSLVNFILLHTLYKLKWHAVLFHTIMLSALMATAELLFSGLLSIAAPTFLQHYKQFPYSLLFSLFSKGFFLIATYLLVFFLKKESHAPQKDWRTLPLLFMPAATIFTLMAQFHIGESVSFSPAMYSLISASAVFLLLGNIFTFAVNQYIQKKGAEYIALQLQLQKESDSAAYYEMLLSQHKNQQILIHDIKKHLQSIDILNDSGDHEKISGYIRSLLQSSELRDSVRICDHHILNMILSRYQNQCREKQISLYPDIRSNSLQGLPDADITAIFCNLLDNAVEAAEKVPDSFIELNVRPKENTPYVIISMINSCCSNPFSAQTGELLSTKKDSSQHGFGIKSVQRIVNRYHGNMNLYYDAEERLFHTILLLPLSY